MSTENSSGSVLAGRWFRVFRENCKTLFTTRPSLYGTFPYISVRNVSVNNLPARTLPELFSVNLRKTSNSVVNKRCRNNNYTFMGVANIRKNCYFSLGN